MPIRKLYSKAKRHREAEILRLRTNPDAARQLGLENRLKPVLKRIGTASGTETSMSELRLRWRKIFRLEDCAFGSSYSMSIVPDPTQPVAVQAPAGDMPPQQPHSAMENTSNQTNTNDAWQNIHSGSPGISIYYEGGNMDAQNPGGLFPGGGSLASMLSIASPAVSGAATSVSNHPEGQTFAGEHLSLWPGSDDFHSHNPHLDDIDELFRNNASNPGGQPQGLHGLDMNMDLGEVEDIDWQNWDAALKNLNKPATDGGIGSSGGM